jgi:hypothetical protein
MGNFLSQCFLDCLSALQSGDSGNSSDSARIKINCACFKSTVHDEVDGKDDDDDDEAEQCLHQTVL